jgi:hypothetical protein
MNWLWSRDWNKWISILHKALNASYLSEATSVYVGLFRVCFGAVEINSVSGRQMF